MTDPIEHGLGVFGGTFNPLHHGHLIAVQEARYRLGLPEVLFVPTARPPHKETPEVSPGRRLEIVRRALEGQERFGVSDVELEREGPSYTVETLEVLGKRYPDRRLVLLTGADELIQFRAWHRWETILERAIVVGMNRPGFDREDVPDVVGGQCRFVEVPSVQISSSTIRRRLRNRDPARWFVPRTVWEYIREHELYGVDER